MKTLLVLALALAGIGGAVNAQTAAPARDCQLRIDPQSSQWIIAAYDPFSGERATGSFQVTYVNDGDRTCRGDVSVRLNGEPYGLESTTVSSAARLPYVLVDEFEGRDLTPYGGVALGQTPRQQLVVESGQRVIRRYSVSVDDRNLGADGLFQQTVSFAVVRPNMMVEAERQVTLALDVRPSAVMGLAGTFTRRGGVARIDMGELSEGAVSLPVSLWVRSTRGYRVDVSSENRGRLVSGSRGWSVPYSLSLGGERIDLGDPSALRSSPGGGLRDDNYPLVLQIGSVDGARAGRYSDLLTLTLAPF